MYEDMKVDTLNERKLESIRSVKSFQDWYWFKKTEYYYVLYLQDE